MQACAAVCDDKVMHAACRVRQGMHQGTNRMLEQGGQVGGKPKKRISVPSPECMRPPDQQHLSC